MLTTNTLNQFRKRLQRERERILAQPQDETAVSEVGRNPDRADLAASYGERERILALTAMEQRHLQQLQKALDRLDSGGYGICAGCGDEITYGRLEIMPHAVYCVACQRRHEQQLS